MLNPIPQQGFHHRIERAHQRVEGDRMAREGAAQLKQELVVLRLLEADARSVWVAEPIDENTAGAVSQPANQRDGTDWPGASGSTPLFRGSVRFRTSGF